MTNSQWQNARRLLCVRLDSLGDVLMTTPALRALKQAAPERSLTLWTSSAAAPLRGLLPDVDDFIVYDAPWMKHSPRRPTPKTDVDMLLNLSDRGFDAAVIFTVFSQNPLPAALTCFLAGIRLRLAYCRENPYLLLSDWVEEDEPHAGIRHETRRQLNLVEQIGCRSDDERLSLEPPIEAYQTVREVLSDHRVTSLRPWLVLHPGASASSRRYPADMFATVVADLIDRHHFQVVLTGVDDERSLGEAIQSRLRTPAIDLIGRLTLPELAALIATAPLLITNNTGPAHIAAAVGTPVVDLYALTNPQHTPWMVPHRLLYHDVPCRYCYKSVCPEQHHNCLRQVSPAEVTAAVLELYAETFVSDVAP